MPTPIIHDREDPKRPSVGQGIMHKIHTPSLVRTTRHGSRSTVKGDMFSSAHPHAELQSIQAVQPSDALPIDEPPLTP